MNKLVYTLLVKLDDIRVNIFPKMERGEKVTRTNRCRESQSEAGSGIGWRRRVDDRF